MSITAGCEFKEAGLIYSVCPLRPSCSVTCGITRVVDNARRDFAGEEVVNGAVNAWLGNSDGRVHTLYNQNGGELNAVAKTGAFYFRHPERGPCLRFTGEPDQVYAIAAGGQYKSEEVTIFHYSLFHSSKAATPTLTCCLAAAVGEKHSQYLWQLFESKADGRISVGIGDSVSSSDKPNGWWRTPMVYAARIGAEITHWIGNYRFDQHTGALIEYSSVSELRIGGYEENPESLFSGYLFDLVIEPECACDADCMAMVNTLCVHRMRPFPFQERVTHVGEPFRHPVADGIDGTNHPVVIRENGIYYLFWNTDITGENRGIHVATSTDMRDWTQRGRVLAPGASGAFDEKLPFAPRLKKINGVWVMWFAAQRQPDGASSIGVAVNSGVLTDPDDWVGRGQIITSDFAGEKITIDPVVYYNANGYDPGTGDGIHPIWLLYGSGKSNSAIYNLYLVFADKHEGPYLPANRGKPVSAVDGKGYPYLWPGDIWRDPHTGVFWKLQSYGVTVGAGYANGNGRTGWTYADSMAGPWYWVPRHMEYIAPDFTSDKRAIELSIYEEKGELHLFTANDSDDMGYRDSVQHWKTEYEH